MRTIRFYLALTACLCFARPVCAQPERASNTPAASLLPDKAVQKVTPERLQSLTRSGQYVHVPMDILRELLRRESDRRQSHQSPVEVADYSATLEGRELIDGELNWQLTSSESGSEAIQNFGPSNLRDLQLRTENGPITLAANPQGHVIPLTEVTASSIEGRWKAIGRTVNRRIEFDLTLPHATVTRLSVQTDTDTTLTSPNATVRAQKAEDFILWTLFPNTPSALKISCEQRAVMTRSDVILTPRTEVRILEHEGRLSWQVPLATTLAATELHVQCSQAISPTSIRLDNGLACRWQEGEGNVLRIAVPDFATPTTLRLEARPTAPEPTHFDVPVLVPTAWSSSFGESGGQVENRFGPTTIVISPHLVVTRLDLNGLLERDVTFAPDGSQTLELRQFRRNARATVHLAPTTPVVADSVAVAKPDEEQPFLAAAYVHVTVRAGELGRVEWEVPAGWRVTRVREAVSDVPLLFQMDTDSASQTNAVTIDLRDPISAFSGDPSTALVLDLQSTERDGAQTRRFPFLTSSLYQRRFDLIAIRASDDASIETLTVNGGNLFAPTDRDQQLTWLPSALLAESTFIQRESSDVLPPAASADPASGLYAAVDYNAQVRGEQVLEKVRIRLRSAQPIPRRVPVIFPAGVDVQVSDESVSQPSPILRRPEQTDSGRWMIELPGPTQEYNTYDFTLVATRPLMDRLPASIVRIPAAQSSGGTIQPPETDVLSLRGDDVVTEVEEYPARPERSEWVLLRQQPEDQQQPIHATAFVRFEPVGTSVIIHGLQRQSVPTDSGQLRVRMPPTGQMHVLVNHRPVFAEQHEGELIIPLPQFAPRTVVTLVWRTTESATVSAQVQLPEFVESTTSGTSLFLQVPEAMGAQLSRQAIRYPHAAASELFPDRSDEDGTIGATTNNESPPRPAPVVLFESQWRQAFDRSAVVYFRNNANSPDPIRLSITSEAWQQAIGIVLALVTFLACCIFLQAWPTLLMVSGLVMLASAVCSVFWTPAHGITAGALLFVCWSAITRLRRVRPAANQTKTIRQLTIQTTATFIVVILLPQTANAQPPGPILLPDLPDASSSFAFVEKSYLDQLKNLAAPTDSVLVLRSDVDVVLESEQSCLVTIECEIACPASRDGRLSLPLDNLVLIDAWIDEQKVFPARTSQATASLMFPADSDLARDLVPEQTAQSATPPRVVGKWNLRTLRYIVRHVPEPAPLAFHINFPLPPSFRSTVRFQDAANLVSRIASAQQETDFAVLGDQALTLPAMFGPQQVDLTMTIDRPATDASDLQAMVVCLAEITPTQERFLCQYQIPPAATRSTQARLKIPEGLRLIKVETEDGSAVPWSADGTGVVVETEPDDDGYQRLMVEYRQDTSTRLAHRINTAALRSVNGSAAAEAFLLLKTSDSFFIRSVKGSDGELAESMVTPEISRFRISRGIDTMLELPVGTNTVTVRIAEIQATQTVRLNQQAVVQEQRIDWSCDCEIELAGQPIFRQWLRLSPAVTITGVAAVRDGASRLQSWTRHDDRVVVTLREATRGNLTIRINGFLQRPVRQDQSLPVIQFPDSVQVTESELVLSSESDIETRIANAGSAVSADGAQVFDQPVGSAPLRLDIVDETEPLVLQGSPAKRVEAEATVLLYEDSQELRCALLLAMEPPEAAFRLRFACPTAEFGSRRPVFLSNREAGSVAGDGGEYVVSLKDQSSAEQILAFADIPVQSSESGLVCHLPRFRAGFSLTEIHSFDLRAGSGSSTVPPWAVRSAEFVGLTQVEPNHVRIESQYDEGQREVVLTPPATRQESGLPENPVSSLLVEGRHLLRFSPDGRLVGTSGFLVFQSQALPLTVELPQSLTLAEVRLDGQTAAAQPMPGGVTVKPDSAVSFLVVTWAVPQSSAGSLQPTAVELPAIAASQSLVTAFVVPPQNRWLWHSVDGALLSVETLLRGSRDSLRRGLGLIGLPDVAGTDQDESNAADLDEQRWTLLQRTNSAGVQAARSFFERCESRAAAAIVDVSDSGSVRISAFRYPAPRVSLSIAAGLILMLTSTVLNRRRRETAADAQTIVQPPDSEHSSERRSTVV